VVAIFAAFIANEPGDVRPDSMMLAPGPQIANRIALLRAWERPAHEGLPLPTIGIVARSLGRGNNLADAKEGPRGLPLAEAGFLQIGDETGNWRERRGSNPRPLA